MKYNAHDYQNAAKEFLISHKEAAVLLDCGMGKSSITLTALDEMLHDYFDISRVLIIAPLRVALTSWPDEINKWDHLKDLTYSLCVGTKEERLRALAEKTEIVIINRENVSWLINESSFSFNFDALVIDELSSFKNHQAKRFKALLKVRYLFKRLIGLTGTPAPNGLMDLWAEFRLLDGGARLGRYITHYRNTYFLPDKRNGACIFSYQLKEGAEESIYKAISDMTVSMRAKDHLTLPEKLVVTHKAVMSKSEEQVYKRLKAEMLLEFSGKEITAANAATLTGKLCQLSSGAIYTDSGESIYIHSRKLDVLEDLLEALNGQNALLVYWFKHDLERLEERLNSLGYSYTLMKTKADIEKWNNRKVQLALVHPASCGHGLNLQSGGAHLIWFTPTWSLELYEQTNARLFRQGQKEKCVVVHHIVTENTIDEKIVKALEKKEKVEARLLDAVKAELSEGGALCV